MWDLDTIKEINKPNEVGGVRSKLWHYFRAWKRFLYNKNKSE